MSAQLEPSPLRPLADRERRPLPTSLRRNAPLVPVDTAGGRALAAVIAILTFLAALGSGLIAGFFLAFSATVMWALERQPQASGIAAMQTINVVVLNAIFLGVFFGTAILSVVLDIVALTRWTEPWSGYLLAGSLLYFIFTFLVTIIFNVPLNNRLAAVEPDSEAAGAFRQMAERLAVELAPRKVFSPQLRIS